MFTGIVESKGIVSDITKGTVWHIKIRAQNDLQNVRIGDSVSVNGVCLTLTSLSDMCFCFDAVRETINRTNLSSFSRGDVVNLETALTLSKPIGGHFVSGHVDGLASVREIIKLGDSREIWFSCAKDLLRYIVEKGSVAIDGVSLTVASVSGDGFRISVIPHTLANTTLADMKKGDKVNLETDILAKYTEKLLGTNSSGIKNTLIMSGYMKGTEYD